MPLTITENTSIDYDINGEGPPLILIGGLENGVADLAAEVVALLDHLGVGKAHVLGTSLGGFVAQELALVRPDLVDGLILICTSCGGRGPEAMSVRALTDMMGWGPSAPRRRCAGVSRRRPLKPTGPSTLRSSGNSCAGV